MAACQPAGMIPHSKGGPSGPPFSYRHDPKRQLLPKAFPFVRDSRLPAGNDDSSSESAELRGKRYLEKAAMITASADVPLRQITRYDLYFQTICRQSIIMSLQHA